MAKQLKMSNGVKKYKPKIIYDKESGVFSIEVARGKSVDSDIKGNVVIDYDKRGEVIKINIYNFDFEQFRDHLNALKYFSRSSNIPLWVK